MVERSWGLRPVLGAVVGIPVLALIAAVHFYWAAGGRVGKTAAVPERDGRPILTPGVSGTLAVGGGLVGAAVIVAVQAGLLWPGRFQPVPRILTGALAVVFVVRAIGDFRFVGFFKKVKGSRFAQLDTLFYSPLCVVLAIALADVLMEPF